VGGPASYTVSGTVRNTGDTVLSNISVTDTITDAQGNVSTVSIPIAGTLAPNATADIPAQTITTALCGPSRDQFSVTAVDSCGNTTTASSAVCTTQVNCPPKVCITKQIACVTSFDPRTCGTYGDTATGVRVVGATPDLNQTPHFCYQIVVSNCGQIALTDVVVTDATLGITENVGNLAIGESHPLDVIVTGWDVNTDNTAFANGKSAATGEAAPQVQATAHAIVKTLSLTCTKSVSVDGGPAGATAEIPQDGSAHTVTYSVTVSNTGDLPLDVSINDPACGLAAPIAVNNLAAGATSASTTVCTRQLTCPLSAADASNTVTVTGQVHQPGQGAICDINAQGQHITATSTCQSTLTCKQLTCVSRTQGYWFNHVASGPGCATLQAAINAAGGSFNLGFTTVNLDQAIGYFWTKGKNSNPVCAARQKAATQLIAAIANVTLLNGQGTCIGGADLIAQAQAALASCNISAINAIQSQLDAFNNAGDNLAFPAGLRPCSAGKDQKAYIDAHAVAPGAACNACP